jgi:hypothetical protein
MDLTGFMFFSLEQSAHKGKGLFTKLSRKEDKSL